MATGNVDRRASSSALSPMAPAQDLPPTAAPRDVALEQLATVQDSHHELRKLLERIDDYFKALNTPAALETFRLTVARPIARSGPVGPGRVSRSVGLINPNNIKTYLGLGGAKAAPSSEALSVSPSSCMVVPVYAEDVDVGADPADLAAGDAVVFLLRFKAVQPFFFGAF